MRVGLSSARGHRRGLLAVFGRASAGILLATGLAGVLEPAIQVVSSGSVSAAPGPSCTSTGFSDDFAADSALSSICWQTETPLISAVEAKTGSTDVAPALSFGSGSMEMKGAADEDELSAIQSTSAYSAPFTVSVSAEGVQSYGNTIGIYLLNSALSEAFSVEGNLNPANTPYYGMWVSNSLPADPSGMELITDPGVDILYDISMSVDAAGNGTVSVNGGTPYPVGQVGSGPFYLLLGQREGEPNSSVQRHQDDAPNVTDWYSASLSAPAPAVTASLSASSATVAGVETVPATAVLASSLGGTSGSGSGAAAAPLSSIPLSSIGLASSPLHSVPLGSIPLSSIAVPSGGDSAVAAAQATLSSAILANLSVTYPAGCGTSPAPKCTGWAGILAGTPYAGVPLEAVTLEDVLANPAAAANLNSVNLGDLNLASSPLSSIPLSSIELSAVPLSSIPLPGSSSGASGALTAWCTQLQSLGFTCSDFGIDDSSATPDDNGVTLLSLALAGVPLSSIPLSSIPLSSIPLSSIDLASSPLSSIPLSSISLQANPLSSIPLSSIDLSSIPLSSIPLSSIGDLTAIVDCSTYASCTTATLGEAYAAGALLPGATLGDLGSSAISSTATATTLGALLGALNTSAPGFPDVTLGDLLQSTTPPASYPWQSVSLSDLPLAADESAGGTVSYTAAITAASASTAQISLDLPATFAYVPGTTTLDGTAAPDPSPGAWPGALSWSLALSGGGNSLSFEARAGIGLGSATASLSATVGSTTSASSATLDVIDGEAPSVYSQSSAVPLSAGAPPGTQGNLNIGYITSPGQLNDWSLTVGAGEELSLALTNLPATYDLELFGPSASQLQGTPVEGLPGVTDTLPSLAAGSTTEATPGSQDLAVTPPAGDQLEAISNNPGGQDQNIQTPPLAAGTYIVQVSGYNGAFSSQPYLLRADLLGGVTAPSCPAIAYPNAMPSPASGPVTIRGGVNTLFLVDTQRLSADFGPAAEETVMSDLQAVALDASAGVSGAVIPVDAYSSVQAAYATWNQDPCSVSGANGVVAAISAVVDQIRSLNPSVQNVVIVGADDQIPFARLPDGATQSNERDYGASTFAGENNVEADALSLGYYFSDDPYAANQPLGVGSATLYTPQLAVGRLVESAAQIESALTRFVSSNGNLDASASLTTGYSFLTAGAEAVSANLGADGLRASTLINGTWTASELDSALTANPVPGVDSLNAHFDYSRALPAYDNTNNSQSNLFTTADLPVSDYAGRLLFSMGCHAGLEIDGAEVAASGVATPVADWAKTFADAGALWVANTGYGYADTDSIAYSAKLMADFAANLNGTLTIGEALSEAKQQYAAGNAVLSPYDLKALMESSFYGLPMYNLNKPGTPVAPPAGPPTTVVDASTGLTDLASPITFNLGQGTSTAPGQLGLVSTPNGDYYQVNGATTSSGGTQDTEYRPIEPLATYPVTSPGLVPHGALVTALSSTDVTGFAPAVSMPAAGSADSSPPPIGEAAFPGTLQRVATYGTFTKSGTGQGAQLDLVAGQFIPDLSTPGSGTERLFNSMSAQVYYLPPTSAYADDYTPATIDSTRASSSAAGISFSVDVTPSVAPVTEVIVLYTDAEHPGTWTEASLSGAGAGTWTGTAPQTASGQAQYIVEALDAAGNVAVSNNEGTAFSLAVQSAVSIALFGNGPTNGYYTGPVSVDITAPSGSTYVLDGSQAAAVPTTGSLVVPDTGEHTVTVTDPSGASATQAFAISGVQTTTVLSIPSSLVVGQPVSFTATVSPATTGAGSPAGNVEFFDGSEPITSCGGSTGTALASSTATCTVSYAAAGAHQITATYLGDSTFAVSQSSTLGVSVGALSGTASEPTVTGFTPTSGPASGGTVVTISGSGLGGAGVTFGSSAATDVSCSATSCTVTSPAGTGTVSVTVTVAGTAVSAGTFTYATTPVVTPPVLRPPAPPSVSGVSPASGPDSGGTVVTISGTNLAGASVELGTNAATDVSCSATSCAATSPAGTGTVSVTVATAGGISSGGSFTYLDETSYTPVVPFRVTDTRRGSGEPNAGQALRGGTWLSVKVAGVGAVPPDATAAVLNVTAVDPTAAGFLAVSATAGGVPLVSSVDFSPGEVVTNLVTVGLAPSGPSSGQVSIYNSAGATNVVVDVEGYYSTMTAGGSGLYDPVTPERVLGSLGAGHKLGAGSAVAVTVAGSPARDGVPASATAVALNLTVSGATNASFLTTYPAGQKLPLTADANFRPGETTANTAIVAVGTGGQIMVYNHAGTLRLDVDVEGYYTGAGGSGSAFVAVQGVRLTDTRSGLDGEPVGPKTSEQLSLAGGSVPLDATAVAANVTVVAGGAPGYLTVYPTAEPSVPVASDLNWTAGETVANFTIADTGSTGEIEVYNSHGDPVNVVIDATGYFVPAS